MTKTKIATAKRQITGKCVSKSNGMMYIFEGADPVAHKSGWKVTANKVHPVISKTVYDKMKVGDELY